MRNKLSKMRGEGFELEGVSGYGGGGGVGGWGLGGERVGASTRSSIFLTQVMNE